MYTKLLYPPIINNLLQRQIDLKQKTNILYSEEHLVYKNKDE